MENGMANEGQVVYYFCTLVTCSFNTYLLFTIFVPNAVLGTRSKTGEHGRHVPVL